jgi:RNA polymerase subunit RPABC4/transcription elongation factor Spt4
LRRIAVAEHGWLVTEDEDVCPDCASRNHADDSNG